eukprot:TRINITY_DN6033_c0_g2_i4.p1 TRINITY_DN6033_c0_g2~~TRINITY_DN6033_c0_g2_i4.p1  ORF type:complete len:219 (+),score=18.26 TRINITY_DN6033_c0_g2_i4:104-760(+)
MSYAVNGYRDICEYSVKIYVKNYKIYDYIITYCCKSASIKKGIIEGEIMRIGFVVLLYVLAFDFTAGKRLRKKAPPIEPMSEPFTNQNEGCKVCFVHMGEESKIKKILRYRIETVCGDLISGMKSKIPAGAGEKAVIEAYIKTTKSDELKKELYKKLDNAFKFIKFKIGDIEYEKDSWFPARIDQTKAIIVKAVQEVGKAYPSVAFEWVQKPFFVKCE